MLKRIDCPCWGIGGYLEPDMGLLFMAKGFPYFKFTSSEWLTGDIVFEDMSTQGLFINICAIYWQRDGILQFADIEKRFSAIIEITELKRIIARLTDRFIWVNSENPDYFNIKFIDEQLGEISELSKQNSENGKKGGRPKTLNYNEKKPKKSDRLANESETKRPPSNRDKIREDKIREDDSGDFSENPTLLTISINHRNKSITDRPYIEYLMRIFNKSEPEVINMIDEFHDYVQNTCDDPRTYSDWKSYLINREKKKPDGAPKQGKKKRVVY